MTRRFLAYAAVPFLVVYLLLLLGSSFVSQQNLRQAANNALLFNLEKRASALSYFSSERKNDFKILAKDPTLNVFFSNRALGMSMEYGLRASLLSMQERFQEIVGNRKLNNAPIYLRLMFIENHGNTLVDVGLLRGKRFHWLNKTILKTQEITTFVIQDGEHNHSIVVFPYFYKEKRIGSIVAKINHDEVLRYLIQPQASENTQYAVLIDDLKHILHREHSEKQQSDHNNLLLGPISDLPVDTLGPFVQMQVPGTPFILAARYYYKSTLGALLTSRWYLLSLVILALLVFYSLVIGIRTRTQNLLLQARSEESDRQSTFLTEKNILLENEVQKRLNSEVRLQTVLETIPDLVWLKDPEGIYLSCNPKYERLFGACEKDIVGKTDHDFQDKELADLFREKDKAVIDAAKPLIYEERVTYADDGHEELLEIIKTPLMDSNGKLVGVLGIARDITARKQAETLLLMERDKLKTIFEAMIDGIYIVDKHYDISYVNPVLTQNFGGYEGRKCYEYFHDRAEPCPWCKNADVFAGKTVRWEWTSEKNGRTYDLIDTPIINADNTISKLEIFRDITEQNKMKEQLLLNEKLATIAGLAAGVAHEINTPLSAILQAHQLVEMGLSPEKVRSKEKAAECNVDLEAVQDYFKKNELDFFMDGIRESALKAGNIIKSLLEFSRPNEGSFSTVNLEDIMESSLLLARSDYNMKKKYDIMHVQIVKEYAPDLPFVVCVPVEIEQVILNLLQNSIQAMAEADPAEKCITLRTATTGNKVVIEVEDNGPGMTDEVRHHIFDPFFTTKEAGSGTGLGLSVSHAIIVDKHKGIISVESGPGQGAKFTIELPLNQAG